MIKNVRLLALLAITLIAAVSIFLTAFMKGSGVEVTSVDVGSKCSDIKIGDVITQINDVRIKNTDDFSSAVNNLAKGSLATMVINNGPGNCAAIQNGDVGLRVRDLPSGGLKFGLELGGGVSNVYSPADSKSIDDIAKIVKKRAEFTGLEVRVNTFVGDDKKSYLKISGVTDEGFDALAIDGKFKAKISQNVEIKDGAGKFVVGDHTHSLKYSEEISIDDVTHKIGEEFLLDDIKFYITNSTNKSISLEALIFSNEDVLTVFSTASYVSYQTSMSQYEFYIPVKISNAAASRFANVTERMNTKIISTNNILLDGELVYSLDNTTISTLPLSFETAGKIRNTLAVIGFYKNAKSANLEKIKIETVLHSGSLPAPLKLIDTEKYVGSLESVVKNYLVFVMLGLLLAVIILGSIVGKSWNKSMYSVFISLCEAIFVLSLVNIVQWFGYNWLIDMGTLAGLFLIIFIGCFDSYFKASKKQKLLARICLFSLGFISLFTLWRGFGMAVVAALVIKAVLTDKMRHGARESNA